MDIPWTYHGNTTGAPWTYHGATIDPPRKHHRDTIVVVIVVVFKSTHRYNAVRVMGQAPVTLERNISSGGK